MLNFIEGNLVEITPAYAVIESHGMGYMANISLRTYSAVKDLQRCKLFTHLAVKSEATTPVGLVLYGFVDEEERHLFLQLISVSGVGANTARLILSSLTLEEIYYAVVNGNAATFQKVKGIGEKSAQRIIIDLKGKIDKVGSGKENILPAHNKLKEEALAALIMLGFTRNIAEKAIEKIIHQSMDGHSITVEELIKQSLKIL